MTAHLLPISAEELTEQELEWLARATKFFYHPIDFKELLGIIVDGGIVLWRLEGEEARGLIGTSLVRRNAGTEMFIELLIGKGLLREAQGVHSAILDTARDVGARRVSGYAVRPGLARLYRRMNATPVATVFTQEI